MTSSHLAARHARILEMAGIGDALHAQVKQYSSGMRARLGFSIAIQAPAEVLLIDELLAVGDDEFRQAALRAVRARRDEGAAVLFVSHELRLVEELCPRVVLIEQGRVIDDGPAAEVVQTYGGAGWSRGTTHAESGVRLLPLEIAQRHISTGGRLEMGGYVVVDEPCPGARLEIAYRVIPDDRTALISEEDRLRRTMYVRTVVPPGHELSEPGWYRYEAAIEDNAFAGEVDAVVSVIDDVVLAECWQQIAVGTSRPEGFPFVNFEFDWTVTRLD
jgi:ABC-type multidrug transport system ATPase subunit